ncbi:MAG: transcriptional regulator [Alphaproteobacteria bacterium]|nr:transcriptional regulator [Alphaproteobacteria bacterium]
MPVPEARPDMSRNAADKRSDRENHFEEMSVMTTSRSQKSRKGQAEIQILPDFYRGSEGVKSACRALEILNYFEDVRKPARLSEIAGALDYPVSSASVLLKTLVGAGYVNYDPLTRTYLPSTRVALMGSWLNHGTVSDQSLVELMNEIGRESGHGVVLGVRNGTYVQYIHTVDATTTLRVHLPVGTRRLLVWSSLGAALLTGSTDDEIRGLVRRARAEQSVKRDIKLEDVLDRVRKIRNTGYLVCYNLLTEGAGMFAMPVARANELRHDLAIGVTATADQLRRDERKIVSLMRKLVVNGGGL